MAGAQKVFLRVVALVGDGPDDDEMPDRVLVTGRGSFIPTMAAGTGDVTQGPDALQEIRLIEPIDFEIIDGVLTRGGEPFVWLPVPTGQWQWRATFEPLRFGEKIRTLDDFVFPLDAATEQQIADPNYPGINLAMYGVSSWEPGTVNLTAEAIQQITIYLGRASNSAIAAGEHADRAEGARDDAQVAQGLAEGARDDAITARGGAEGARDDAQAAQGLAEGARDDAQDAQRLAEGARDDAQAAQGLAEGARDDAQAAQGLAEGAHDGAQAAREDLEQARDAATTARVGAEEARDEAVAARGFAEGARSDAQAAQGLAEGARDDAQDAQGLAEDARDDAVAARGLAEGARDDAQDARDAAGVSAGRADDERILAQDAAARADVAADNASTDAGRAEDAAATAQAQRWVPRGEYVSGTAYEAGDVVLYDEVSYYAQAATDVAPPSSPWVVLASGGGGITHWSELDGVPDAFPAEAHTHDAGDIHGGATPSLDVSEASVGALSVEEALGSKSDAGHTHVKSDVGLGNVDNTSDANKPVSTATQAALNLKVDKTDPRLSDARVPTSHTHTKGEVGLGNVDNTSDANKPVSTATQAALNLKVDKTDPRLSDARVPTAHTHVKSDVGLGNVDNTSDANKPISTATQAALSPLQARAAAAPATWHWDGTSLPTSAAQVHTQARVGDFIVAPNLDTDPGWHRITGV